MPINVKFEMPSVEFSRSQRLCIRFENKKDELKLQYVKFL